MLENLHRTDLPTALWNLREVTGEWLLISVSTQPSSHDNRYHATVAPRRTWRRLFQALGFAVEPRPVVQEMAFHREYPGAEIYWCLNQWRQIDPFHDAQLPEPYFLLLRKRDVPLLKAGFTARANDLLNLDRSVTETRPVLKTGAHLTFLIGHYQDFHHYRLYWDMLDPDSVTVLVRSGAIRGMEIRRYRAVLAYLQSRGLNYREVESVEQVDWTRGKIGRNAFIVATESTAIDLHLLNAAFVLAARAAGYRTFQIQHGIWTHADFHEQIAFACEHVLTWSNEFRDGFAAPFPAPHNTSLARGLIRSTRFTTTSSTNSFACSQTSPPLGLCWRAM